jgi:hypothetical protein
MKTIRTTTPKSIDEYIKALPADVRPILKKIRATIRAAAPGSTEAISYGMPAFRLDGIVIYFAAFKAHIGLYPPVSGDAGLMKAIAPYAGPKGNLKFPLDVPIPYALITRIVRARVKHATAKAKPVKLLSGGNPQIAKADGAAPVQAYIAAMPGWTRGIGKRLDSLIVRRVPSVRKAVKWNSPFYGIEGQGWFLSFHTFTNYVKVTFFRGTSLQPVPPGGTGKDARWIDVHKDDLDEAQMVTWIRQAAGLPGWGQS